MLLMQQPVQPAHARDGDLDDFYRQARKIARERRLSKPSVAEHQSSLNDSKQLLWPFSSTLSRTPIRRKSSARSDPRSSPPASNGSNSPPLRLADLAKQQVMATHVDNWREDMIPVRQHLPMQHIIGSLKRDREESVKPARRNTIASSASSDREHSVPALSPSLSNLDITAHYHNLASTPSSTADSFLDLLRTPKSDATSPQPDTDRRFSYQAPEHVAKDIPQSALPGLNMALNLATITPDERDLFSEYAPRDLDDPHMLMDEVIRMRDLMMRKQNEAIKKAQQIEEAEDVEQDLEMEVETEMNGADAAAATNEAGVAKDFDEFVNYRE